MNGGIAIALWLGLIGTAFVAGHFLTPVEMQTLSDAEYKRAEAKNQAQQMGVYFDDYLYSHPDTPGPEIKFPEVDTLDPMIWDWVEHTMLKHEKQLTSWASDYPTPFSLTSANTFYVTSSGTNVVSYYTSNGTVCNQQ